MHEQNPEKTQRQNKLPLPLLSLLLQILFNVNFSSIQKFIINNFRTLIAHLISCSFSLIVTFTTFCNSLLHARMLCKISEPFIWKFFEHSRSFGVRSDSFIMYYIKLKQSQGISLENFPRAFPYALLLQSYKNVQETRNFFKQIFCLILGLCKFLPEI